MNEQEIIIHDNIEEDDPLELTFPFMATLKEVIDEYLNLRDWSVDHTPTYEDLIVVKKSLPRQPLSSHIKIADLATLHPQSVVELLVIAPSSDLSPLIEVHFRKEVFYTVERYNKHEKLSRFLKCGLPGLEISQFENLILLVNQKKNYSTDLTLVEIFEKEGKKKKLVLQIENKADYNRRNLSKNSRESIKDNEAQDIIEKKVMKDSKRIKIQNQQMRVYSKQDSPEVKIQVKRQDQQQNNPQQKSLSNNKPIRLKQERSVDDFFYMTLVFETLLNGNTQNTMQIVTPLDQKLQTFFPTILQKITCQGFDWHRTDFINKDNLEMLLDDHMFSIWNKSFRQLQFKSKGNYLFKLKRHYAGG